NNLVTVAPLVFAAPNIALADPPNACCREIQKMCTKLSETQSIVLRELCDTFVPSIHVEQDPLGFWARTASDIGSDQAIAKSLFKDVPEPLRNVLIGLLDDLGTRGFAKASQQQREEMPAELSSSSPKSANLIAYFQKQTLVLTYGLPEEPGESSIGVTYGSPEGQNPNWEAMGYPGPVSIPHPKPKQISTVTPQGDHLTMDADVCIVGSGAGGAAIAAKLSARGQRVVILEAGGHYNSADFHPLER